MFKVKYLWKCSYFELILAHSLALTYTRTQWKLILFVLPHSWDCRHFNTPVGSQITLIFFVYCEFLLSLFYVLLRSFPYPHSILSLSYKHNRSSQFEMRMWNEAKKKDHVRTQSYSWNVPDHSSEFVIHSFGIYKYYKTTVVSASVRVSARIVFRLYAYKLFVYLCCASTSIHSNK